MLTRQPPISRLRTAEHDDLDRALIERARREGTPAARRAAVEALLPRAKGLARRYHRGEEPLEDLEQVAALGLLKAIDGFDLDRGTPFGSYAVPTIVGELRRHYRDKGWIVRVPRELQELSVKLPKATEAAFAALGRPPTPAELAERLDTTVERVLEVHELGTARRPVSLDGPIRRDTDVDGEALVEHLGSADPAFDRADDAFLARTLLERLPERDRRIVELRFGEELSQSEIGQRLGISQMHVSRLLRRSLDQLSELAESTAA